MACVVLLRRTGGETEIVFFFQSFRVEKYELEVAYKLTNNSAGLVTSDLESDMAR
jgi:hypothetical protein